MNDTQSAFVTNRYKKLVIISHTAHQLHPTHGYVGWGSTIREINFLANSWQEVIHIACLEDTPPAGSSQPYTKQNIAYEPIPTFGGRKWWQKINIIYYTPIILLKVHKVIKEATEVQIRLPMGIGLPLLLYFKLRKKQSNQILWVKYATNWDEPSSSPSYRLQQLLLKHNWIGCKVTINGNQPNQPPQCITFENPCLTEEQHEDGHYIASKKKLVPPYTFIFIGRVDADKGADLLLESLNSWPKDKIDKLHIVGEGPLVTPLKNLISELNLNAQFHGFTSQEIIFELLKESHFLVLPSKSEGFPKVVAEALNFGCLPVISNVGSIPHYILDGETGLIIPKLTKNSVSAAIIRATELNPLVHNRMIMNGRKLANRFTFETYLKKLHEEILSVN